MLVPLDRGMPIPVPAPDQEDGGEESIRVVAIEARDAGLRGRGASI